MSAIIERARSAFDKGIKFNMSAGLVSPDAPLPMDANGETNCVNFVAWAHGIDLSGIPYPRIDWMYRSYPEAKPDVGVLLCRPSARVALGTVAMVSRISDGKVAAIILASPSIPGTLGEVDEAGMERLRIFRQFVPFRLVKVVPSATPDTRLSGFEIERKPDVHESAPAAQGVGEVTG